MRFVSSLKETAVRFFPCSHRPLVLRATAATCVSEPPGEPAARAPYPSLFRALARPSLCILLAIMPSACLVASTPEFDEPAQTRPFLVAAAADPDLREFLLVVDDDQRVDFRASVISEDRAEPLKIALYVDYGLTNNAGNPFRQSIADFPDIPAGTLKQGPRPVHAEWFLDSAVVPPGCHTITMMVTHKFDFRKCPDRLADSSHLVWNILRCTSAEACTFDPFKDCPNSLGTDLVTCPSKSPGPDSGVGGGGGQ